MKKCILLCSLGALLWACQSGPEPKALAQGFLNDLQTLKFEPLSRAMAPAQFKALETYRKITETQGPFTLNTKFTLVSLQEQKDQAGKFLVTFQAEGIPEPQTLYMVQNQGTWEFEAPKYLLNRLMPAKVPAQLFLDYMTALDFDGAATVATEEGAIILKGLTGMLAMMPKDQLAKEAKKGKVTEVKETGDTAEVTYTEEGSSTPKTLALRRVQGEWKVDFKKDMEM